MELDETTLFFINCIFKPINNGYSVFHWFTLILSIKILLILSRSVLLILPKSDLDGLNKRNDNLSGKPSSGYLTVT